jgi:hypothetical protein
MKSGGRAATMPLLDTFDPSYLLCMIDRDG